MQEQKEEILLFLANNITCFRNVTVNDFYLLATLDSDTLGFMNQEVAKVTPLLKQICNYSLMKEIISLTEFQEIENCFGEDNFAFIEGEEVIDKCYDYVEILIGENCHHPSIINAENISSSQFLYDKLMEDISELMEFMIAMANEAKAKGIIDNYTEIYKQLIDLGNNVDDQIVEMITTIFDTLKKQIQNGVITTKEDILWYMNDFAQSKTKLMLFLPKETNHNHIYYVDNQGKHYANVLKNGKLFSGFKQTLYETIISINQMIGIVERYKQENFLDIDQDQHQIINHIEEAYYLYRSYKYRYLQDSYREQKLLEKCKKL